MVTTGPSDELRTVRGSPGSMPAGVRSIDLGDVSEATTLGGRLAAAVDTLATALDGSIRVGGNGAPRVAARRATASVPS